MQKNILRTIKTTVLICDEPYPHSGNIYPKAVIEKYYTEAVFYDEAINDVLPEAYESAVKESGLDVVAKPEIDVEEIKKGEPVVFTALVTTKPEVELGKYKGVKVEVLPVPVETLPEIRARGHLRRRPQGRRGARRLRQER